jgi:hypothetical protein
MYEVQRGVPIPKTFRPDQPKRMYPFRELEVGDSFFVPDRAKNNLMTAASTEGRNLGWKFTTKLCWMLKTSDGWRNSTPKYPGAVQGIGVWRIK